MRAVEKVLSITTGILYLLASSQISLISSTFKRGFVGLSSQIKVGWKSLISLKFSLFVKSVYKTSIPNFLKILLNILTVQPYRFDSQSILSPDFNEDVIAVTALMPDPKIAQYLDSSMDLSIFSRILKFGLPDLV